jgi:hypothetical protein
MIMIDGDQVLEKFNLENVDSVLKHLRNPVIIKEGRPFIYEYDARETIAHINSTVSIVEREYAAVLVLEYAGNIRVVEVETVLT